MFRYVLYVATWPNQAAVYLHVRFIMSIRIALCSGLLLISQATVKVLSLRVGSSRYGSSAFMVEFCSSSLGSFKQLFPLSVCVCVCVCEVYGKSYGRQGKKSAYKVEN